MNIKIKRVYEQPDKKDGERILVDRLWPRGLTKEKASVDLWLKEIAPSTELRKWFDHDPEKWKSFRGRYETEIRHKDDLIKVLKQKAREGTITLIYGARDEKHNEALVLKQFLEKSDKARIRHGGKNFSRSLTPSQRTRYYARTLPTRGAICPLVITRSKVMPPSNLLPRPSASVSSKRVQSVPDFPTTLRLVLRAVT